ADVTVGTVPLSVQFTDSSTGSPTAWKWSFGDGTSSELQNPEHHYASGGIFTVRLNVTNAGGSDELVRTNYITVTGSPAPASALTVTVDLDKTYKFSHANVSTIRIIDINNPELSKVEILSTTGDGSDVRQIAQPQIDNIRRIFSTTNGTFKGTTISVDNADSTISYVNRPDYRIYIQPKVPTFKITAPGRIGNPVVLKYNDSWDKTDISSVGALLDSSDVRYLYKVGGVLYESPTDYKQFPSTGWVYDKNNMPYTLTQNLVTLDPFTALSSASTSLGQTPSTRANTGKYYAGAITHNEPAQTTTIYALSPVIALKSETPILWTDTSGPYALPMTYKKGQDGDVVLSFSGSNPDVPTSIGYVFINSTAHYNMNVTVDIQRLAQNADTRWSTLASNSPVIELLYKSINDDVGDAYTYNLTAVGQQTPPNANVYSNIAITPGYGISSKTTGTSITIPASNFSSLNNGVYYVYLMGTNSDKNIVALSQGQVSIIGGATPEPLAPTITSISPISSPRNTTVNFTLVGTNFPTAFGTSGVVVNLTKIRNTTITTTITSVTSTTIKGSFNTSMANLNDPWNVELITNDAGMVTNPAVTFTISVAKPTVTTLAPVTGNRNATVSFTVVGTNFQTGTNMTYVRFMNATSGALLNTTVPELYNLTPTRFDGKMIIPADALTGSYKINVSTIDGGFATVSAAPFTVSGGKPTVATLTPVTGNLNTTVSFTVIGTNFQTGSNMTYVRFMHATSGALLNTTVPELYNITPTRFDGKMIIPVDALTGSYKINVTTTNGGFATVSAAPFTVSGGKPTVATLAPVTGYKNATVSFTVIGTNFQTGSNMTYVRFMNATSGALLNTTVPELYNITPTKFDGRMIIPVDALTGSYKINVTTTNGGFATSTATFLVSKVPAPTITSITPTVGSKNTTVNFTIVGTNFQTDGLKTRVRIYEDVVDTEMAISDLSVTPTKILGSVNITNEVLSGIYNLEVSTVDGGTATKAGAFTAGYAAIPTITTITPITGYKNATVVYTIRGTNFQPGNTIVAFKNQTTNTALNTTDLISVNSTYIIGTILVPYNAPASYYRLDITTLDGGVVNKVNAFKVNAFPLPTVTTITPNNGFQNYTVGYSIVGTNFQPGMTTVAIKNQTTGAILNTTELTSVTSTKIIGNITIPDDAPTGKYRLEVTTVDGGTVPVANAFTVNAVPTPTIGTITPGFGNKNSVVAFTLTGTNFELNNRTTVTMVDDTSGTELGTSLLSVTSTKIIGSVTIPTSAPAGKYRLQVSSIDGGTVNKLQTFTVNAMQTPVITSIATIPVTTPPSGYLNTTVPFTLKGNNFLDGGTIVRLRATGSTINATISSVTATGSAVPGSDTITGTFFIGSNNATGLYRLDVITNGGGFSSKQNAFTVQRPVLAIGTISPVSGYKNTTVAFTLSGTNFQDGATTVKFLNQSKNSSLDPFVQMNPTIFSITPTQIVGSVDIPYNASLNLWKINVTTADSGEVTKAGLFTVKTMDKPTISIVSPSKGAVDSVVSYTITGKNFQTNGGTTVLFKKDGSGTIGAKVNSVTPTSISGTVSTTGAATGIWKVEVKTADGGFVNSSSIGPQVFSIV
ncbi:MAG: PKD domain-containing protein, partial [Methanoregula sp.]|nr:PKD domain-containing protein [Methanoregula sp.]